MGVQVLEETLFRSQSAPGDALASDCGSTHAVHFMDSMLAGSGEWSFFPRHKSFPEPQIKPDPHEASQGSGKHTPEANSPTLKSKSSDTCSRLERKCVSLPVSQSRSFGHLYIPLEMPCDASASRSLSRNLAVSDTYTFDLKCLLVRAFRSFLAISHFQTP